MSFSLALKQTAKRAARSMGVEIRRARPERDRIAPEIEESEWNVIARYADFTLTPPGRRWALVRAVKYLARNRVPGDIVECGVWRGGSMMIAKEVSRQIGISCDIYLFDTFEGMTEPTEEDRNQWSGESAASRFEREKTEGGSTWDYASLDEVEDNFRRFGLMDSHLIFRKGPVEQTLRSADPLPDQISLLRLDTDWYASTKVELEVLYPRLVRGGVLFIDDYGTWGGAKQAVDEYFAGLERTPLFVAVDKDCRLAVKQ